MATEFRRIEHKEFLETCLRRAPLGLNSSAENAPALASYRNLGLETVAWRRTATASSQRKRES